MDLNYKKQMETMNTIYYWLEDDISKGIFQERMIHNITNTNIFGLAPYVGDYLKQFYVNLENLQQIVVDTEQVIIYGCTLLGREIYRKKMKNCKVLFCDRNYKSIKNFEGVEVISPDTLIDNYSNAFIILCVGGGKVEVTDFLLKNKINKNKILNVGITDVENQYFDELLHFSDNEVFVDAGAFDGSTSVRFSEKMKEYGGVCSKIFAFEPDFQNYILMQENEGFKHLKNTKTFNLGLWNKEETLFFTASANEGTRINNSETKGNSENLVKLKCNSLDSILGSERVTFIKMDVEGAELKVLEGAEKLIKRNKPKLAISIYHKPEDLLELPIYIKSLVPEYKLFLRHHSSTLSETVLYAIL